MAILLPLPSQASSTDECSYELKIIEVTESYASVEETKSSTSELRCKLLINGGKVPLNKISKGKKLVKKDATLKVKRMSYSGMGEKGPVSSVTWEFSQ